MKSLPLNGSQLGMIQSSSRIKLKDRLVMIFKS